MRKETPLKRRIARRIVIAASALALLPSGAEPTAAAEDTFEETERITAIDLLVDVYPKLVEGVIDPVWSRLPPHLTVSDFEIDDRGETRTPIAVAAQSEEPWRIVIYVDQHLSSTASIRRGASLLAARAKQLTDLGTVEIVAATPRLRQKLAPIPDSELVDAALSHLALSGHADDQLRSLRAEYLLGRDDPDLEASDAERATAYAAEETRLIQNGFDDLLLQLLDAGTPRERKALFVLSDGFDLDPARFYSGTPSSETSALESSYREFLRTVASYGWVVIPVRAPLVYEYPDSIGLRRALLTKIDGNRNPERAEALLELGRTQLEQQRWTDAVDTLEEAIHRFYDHPKTRKRQAVAETLLADALAKQGQLEAAELALRRAVALEPSLGAELLTARAVLLEPQAPLDEIATASAGVVAVDPEALGEALQGLERRVRLTYQIPGVPDGELYPVTVEIDRLTYGARAAGWVRSSTPQAVAAARARHRLRSYESQHDDDLEAEIETTETGLRAIVELPTIESELPVGPFRLTVALDGAEMLPEVTHIVVATEEEVAEVSVARPAEAEWVALLLEDLGTGARRERLASAR